MNLEGKNQRSIRTENILQVLRILVFQGPCSRRKLATQLGLSKMCITNIVNYFIKIGLVEETENLDEERLSVGPRPVLLRIATGKIVAIGVHITETEIQGQLLDISMDVVKECQYSIEGFTSKNQIVQQIKRVIDELKQYGESYKSKVIAIGITDSHLLNRTKGSVTFKGNSIGLDMDYIKSSLGSQYSLPIYIEDDMMGMLVAEMAYGYYDIHKKYYFLYIAEEIRGAYANGYYIQKGAVGLSGLVGHMSIKWDGPRCRCGNRGCYESYASTLALLQESNCTNLNELNNNLINRDPAALRALENFVQASAVAFTNIVNLYDPEAIVVMGKAVQLEGAALKKIEYLVNNSFVYRKSRNLKIIPSTLSDLEYKRGAAIMAFNRFFGDPKNVNTLCSEKE